MKKIAVLIGALVLSACHGTQTPQENINADQTQTVCRDHVEYLYYVVDGYSAGYVPHLKVDGKPYTC